MYCNDGTQKVYAYIERVWFKPYINFKQITFNFNNYSINETSRHG